jgi:hypothetical protein
MNALIFMKAPYGSEPGITGLLTLQFQPGEAVLQPSPFPIVNRPEGTG